MLESFLLQRKPHIDPERSEKGAGPNSPKLRYSKGKKYWKERGVGKRITLNIETASQGCNHAHQGLHNERAEERGNKNDEKVHIKKIIMEYHIRDVYKWGRRKGRLNKAFF